MGSYRAFPKKNVEQKNIFSLENGCEKKVQKMFINHKNTFVTKQIISIFFNKKKLRASKVENVWTLKNVDQIIFQQ